ncbi:MAG TPA: hypothetical protein DCZ05_12285 [Deltaproteobacteria bacterium]|nr:hypothetical protein [Deltaproteobacteria bacterium]
MLAQKEISSAEVPTGEQAWLSGRQVSLVEVLDRVLNKGAVLTGGITISVADIPLIYVGLNLLIASVETLARHQSAVPDTAQAGRTEFFTTGEKVYGG